MVEIFYRYRVHPAQIRAFEHAYGADGPWVKLFRRHPDFQGTRLFRHRSLPGVYVTIDQWKSKAGWDAFRRLFAEDYLCLDKKLALLKLEEHLLGFYEGPSPYPQAEDTTV